MVKYPLRELHRQQVWPLKMGWRDLCFLLAYGLCMLGLPAIGMILLVGILQGGLEEQELDSSLGLFAQGAVYLSAVSVLVVLCWAEFRRSARTFRIRPGLKWGMVPAWVAINFTALLILGALMQALSGSVDQSENQQALEKLAQGANVWVFLIPTVLCAPLVEEYVFRHILIGKLSRWIPVWILVPVSALGFMALHAGASGFANPLSLLPYLVMGVVFSLAYLWSGRSFLYTALIHGIHNLIATLAIFLSSSIPQ